MAMDHMGNAISNTATTRRPGLSRTISFPKSRCQCNIQSKSNWGQHPNQQNLPANTFESNCQALGKTSYLWILFYRLFSIKPSAGRIAQTSLLFLLRLLEATHRYTTLSIPSRALPREWCTAPPVFNMLPIVKNERPTTTTRLSLPP